jgi:hypothetical protein
MTYLGVKQSGVWRKEEKRVAMMIAFCLLYLDVYDTEEQISVCREY